jgi:GNAT superfamily N-acetyltransferase
MPGDMNTEVRRAVEADAEAIAALHIRSWQYAYRGQLPDGFLDNLSNEVDARIEFWRTHIATQHSGRHEIWAIDVGAQLNGFAALGPARDNQIEPASELYAIYVNPDRWRRGLGSQLLAHAARRFIALGYSVAILWVLESNLRARRFYERSGWTLDGETKTENLPGGTQLHEVRYRTYFDRKNKNEES